MKKDTGDRQDLPPDEAQEAEEAVRVLVVDDHAIWRAGVRSLLEGTPFRVVGEAASGREALEQARALQPRLVLLDIRMEHDDGLDALQALKGEHPQMIVVLLTTYDDPAYLARAVAGGAAGYLLKGIRRKELLQALQAVVRGEMLLGPEDLARSLRDVRARDAAAAGQQRTGFSPSTSLSPLSEREQDVLRLLASGLNNRDIGVRLFVAESTIKTHVEHIFTKLRVSDRVQAAVWAARHGFAPEQLEE
jgi:DNA-binding NarL/FixJ family response regulator